MSDKVPTHRNRTLYVAFLSRHDIPGRRHLTGELVQDVLRLLAPKIVFVKIVFRPDTFLILCESSATEQSILEALRVRLVHNCVVIEVGMLRRILQAAQTALRSIEQPAEPMYRLTIEGFVWEWCLVLCSEQLPSNINEEHSPFPPTTIVAPVCTLNSRALLVRKRRTSRTGTRIMTGDLLIKPWARALKRTGIGPTCLTSRTLHHIDRVLEAAGEVDILGEIGAKRFQNT
jgi:hypothetical protein